MVNVQTALGPIPAERLGRTLSHEHLVAVFGGENHIYPWRFVRERILDRIVAHLEAAKTAGVDSVIDLTTPDLGRDVNLVRDASRRSGVRVIVATGWWLDVSRGMRTRSPDRVAELFEHELTAGIGSSDIIAGVIKVASNETGVSRDEENVLRGAARAARRTGRPISTHSPGYVGAQQLTILEEERVPPNQICLGHSANTADVDYLEGLLERGVYLSMDGYRPEAEPNWTKRNATVAGLVARGWSKRLMLGHDHIIAGARAPGSGPEGFLFLPTVVLPALVRDGVSEADVATMMEAVPRRFLEGG